ncbi:nitroreductase family protein [Mycobacterium sp. JS623]|uniref:nitroreductase family protein n=1 Tax=Mycobacterium sp. JS623 TaxID=212767 RepID=UPI001E3B25CE|nr:nitroreductase family protein [Mycobacterium sp. JS623]
MSPRLFDADAVLAADDLVALLKAARWAATWGHRQPVRFLVGLRGGRPTPRSPSCSSVVTATPRPPQHW